ncbi:hypothetical protein CcaverHIS002_0602040 [Cutaneotrichosporon cavernicola]|uniref:Uncharacterized protein n=1 Tax=Cutaneotrichosporon cavernicola TaxID=279322 RepID=A0AA48L5V8_9TREE|nr:uncharacterized protein CcaverHIS019_0502140 [Cutaneotrichosporon cavernicola]BEI85917.1 hypothetical protein CcaverHIS002_0602040 [Cutaneotrichosporon cavernicola]BEI92586.1 hypothetical protein CcaverHIS019_0502140 [Cutaneotrichosporon cavernicola]BEJ00361.1 hypothetical protein CcaverHIS631_0502180 [Cutaneotrichosporon cavernicola]BEJ08131.1 hypothetical protein CcaverHIS641_0502160 [Cutaneotrichosporon cavernicola]
MVDLTAFDGIASATQSAATIGIRPGTRIDHPIIVAGLVFGILAFLSAVTLLIYFIVKRAKMSRAHRQYHNDP